MLINHNYKWFVNCLFRSIFIHSEMEIRGKYSKLVRNILTYFGVNFVFLKLDHELKLAGVVFLQVFFIFVTIFCTPSSLDGVTLAFYMFLLAFQILTPLFIEILIYFEAYKKRDFEFRIVEKFQELDLVLEKNFNVFEVPKVNNICAYLVLKFLILLLVRGLKILYAGEIFSLNMMFSELVCSAGDYSFTYYVDLLRAYIKTYCKEISHNNIKELNIHEDYLTFYKLFKLLTRRFSITLLSNISFTFITLVMSCYWIFIRITYGPLR